MPGALVALFVWFGFFGALGLEMWLDHAMRVADGDLHDGGLSREVFLGLHGLLSVLALGGLVYAARGLPRLAAIGVVLGQLAVGALLYLAACLAYTIGCTPAFF